MVGLYYLRHEDGSLLPRLCGGRAVCGFESAFHTGSMGQRRVLGFQGFPEIGQFGLRVQKSLFLTYIMGSSMIYGEKLDNCGAFCEVPRM